MTGPRRSARWARGGARARPRRTGPTRSIHAAEEDGPEEEHVRARMRRTGPRRSARAGPRMMGPRRSAREPRDRCGFVSGTERGGYRFARGTERGGCRFPRGRSAAAVASPGDGARPLLLLRCFPRGAGRGRCCFPHGAPAAAVSLRGRSAGHCRFSRGRGAGHCSFSRGRGPAADPSRARRGIGVPFLRMGGRHAALKEGAL